MDTNNNNNNNNTPPTSPKLSFGFGEHFKNITPSLNRYSSIHNTEEIFTPKKKSKSYPFIFDFN